MMSKLTKKAAIALAVGTMTIAAAGAIAHASDIQKIETVEVSVDDCTCNIVVFPEDPDIDVFDRIGSWFN